MVSTTLSSEMIVQGEKLLAELDRTNIKVDAALWFYVPDLEKWRLLLSLPETTKVGPRRAYSIIQTALLRLDDVNLLLADVSVLNGDDPLLQGLRTAIKTGPGMSGIRFARNVVSGLVIEDAYIYRLE